MRATGIDRERWREFADEFSRQHEGWPIVIETPGRHRRSQPEMVTLPFHAIELDQVTGIATLTLGDDPDRFVTYSIGGVRSLVLESAPERSESSIRIESEDGMETVLHFELTDVGALDGDRGM